MEKVRGGFSLTLSTPPPFSPYHEAQAISSTMGMFST